MFIQYGYIKLPVPIKSIINMYPNIRLIPYSYHMQKQRLRYDELIHFGGSEDAWCDYEVKRDRYIIFYNDIKSNKINSYRYRWSLAHELGHVLLKHHKIYKESRLFRNSLSDALYNQLENEADSFAKYSLVPHGALSYYKIEKYQDIQRLCKISGPAAEMRYQEYRRWQAKSKNSASIYDKTIYELYIKGKNCYTCLNCHAQFNIAKAKYCPYCGSHVLRPINETLKSMKYKEIKTDWMNRVTACLRCGNECIFGGSERCQICRAPLINYCTYCKAGSKSKPHQAFPANARFCPFCGHETLFHQLHLLQDWFSERIETELQEFLF